jgi:hypothetical protein
MLGDAATTYTADTKGVNCGAIGAALCHTTMPVNTL